MSLNKAMLIGNLGRDPDTKSLPSGQSVCEFSVATTERYNDREGNKQEKTQWHRVKAFGKLADVCSQYLAKGRQVYVEGRIETREYEARDGGGKRYITEIVANSVQFLGAKGESNGRRADTDGGSMSAADDEDIPF